MSAAVALQGAIVPDWPAHPRVGALMSTRAGGASAPPYDTLNLGRAVGDDPAAVEENRRRFVAALGGARPVWLTQVHGALVVHLRAGTATAPPEADAAIATEPGPACVVSVADCLPLLFAAPGGRGVGAAHAGWRGLAAGVLQNTVRAMRRRLHDEPARIVAYLGPAIGPARFEVGEDVLAAMRGQLPEAARAFRAGAPGKYLADLYALARQALAQVDVVDVHGGQLCTASDPERFYSFRRDRVTGRHAALIWRKGGVSPATR